MKFISRTSMLSASVLAWGAFAAAAAATETKIYALVGDKTIVTIDANDAVVERRVVVSGGPVRLAGFDIRPADGKLYGVFTNGQIAVINPRTGRATLGAVFTDDFSDATYSFDFNPVVDRLRIIGGNDRNMRGNVDTGGALTTDAPITGPMPNPFGDPDTSVIGAAYINSFAGALATQLYDIDGDVEALYLQVPPNNGTLSAVGQIDSKIDDLGFDIFVDRRKRNRGLFITRGRLGEIDLAGGAVLWSERVRGLTTAVRDIAIAADKDGKHDNDDD